MKSFYSEHYKQILIEIKNDHFFFYHQSAIDYFNNRKQYVEDNEIDSDDELEEPTNFYYIPINEWKRDKTENLDREDNWHNHMKEKNWFTK